ncbi:MULTISPECIES: PhoH family protein [Methylobacterium]|jgi:phosphate starvation-inducible PhoH-like protein|uniref:PhoH-like protein n=1 Tax=Methylobacterium bullatum TaxID=570505 RepID=A0A679JX34_9HYPH|nr:MULTISPECIES: PhoH family protein [Methylobacterium]KQO54567.1 phosphate starvation-inducible protein PhoH [Methylobacterium sp. Leaf85]KQP07029.1 phosphate starvation-inducible protein PhoH [Methylobacterium sp. Leaf93]KQP41695.1 phosphate starvation-inducible protein PhoH [Methylobacterium sp. Leaf106]MBD8903257.1 PhoH family protein [Methylobacterium bullatum]MCC0806259.1 PhoH family protein [Methylobacterium sp. W2]
MKRRRTRLELVEDRPVRLHRTRFDDERNLGPIQPLTVRQAEYLDALAVSKQVIVLGPAGTGKTYIAGTRAADQLRQRRIAKVIITRPNVPSGRSLGFFPGSLEEKIAPWVTPLTETMKERMGDAAYEIAMKTGDIEVVPFEVMRGRTFKNCLVILDEAQNTTTAEIKMFLTRIGDDCQVIINGDVSQTDLRETSGLRTVIHLVKSRMMQVPIVEFTLDDIVRSGICAEWVRAFEETKL